MRKIFAVVCFVVEILVSASSYAQRPLWARANTGAGIDAWPVATDPSGNIFAAGFTLDFWNAQFGSIVVPNTGTYTQPIMVKYDPSGNVLWATAPINGSSSLISIATDNNGNSFMLGSMTSPSLQVGPVTLTNAIAPQGQYFIAKYDPAGNVMWAKSAGGAIGIVTTAVTWVLGAGGITTDAAGNIYIASNFYTASVNVGSNTLVNADPTGNSSDILVAKYDPSGNLVWANRAGGAKDDYACGITIVPSGDIYIAGSFSSPSITFGPSVVSNASAMQLGFIARYNSSGIPVWACGSGGALGADAVGLQSDVAGNVYMVGGFYDNSISYSGTTIVNPIPGRASMYLVKFTPSNSVSWAKTIFAPVTPADSFAFRVGVWGYSIAISKCGVIWVSGVMNNSINIDGNILPVPKDSPDPIFIAGYTLSGTYAGSVAIQSGGDDQSGIACDPSGNLFLCSDYMNRTPFVAGNDTLPGDYESNTELMYVLKYPYINILSENFKHGEKEICLAGELTLNAPTGFNNYLWSDGHAGSTYKVTDTGVFWVYGYDSCASSEADTFRVTNGCDCGAALFVPNAFTPNGDGQDDVFYPRCGAGIIQVKSFRVYNRWGELLFDRENLSPNDISNAWNGTYKGSNPLPDVYVWVADIICESGKTINKKGSITVIR